MKTLNRYVFFSFFTSFLLAFLVLTFVMTIGLMVQIVGFILDGLPMRLVGEFAAVSFPETLQWTMPLALLVSSVLVFSRLSADSEIAAMRACGINLLSVMRGPILFAVFCTALGVYINNEIAPRGHEVRRTLKTKVSVGTGLDMLEPMRIIDDFPKVKVYFSSKEGNWLKDLMVMDYSNTNFVRMITAAKALVTSENCDIVLDLYQMTVDPLDEDHRTMAHAARFQYRVPDALEVDTYSRKDADYHFFEALDHVRAEEEVIRRAAANPGEYKPGAVRALKRDLSKLKVEISKRFVFAFASLCFVLVGIPLGIKSQRKESSVGMAISLAVSLGYYMVVILMLSCQKNFSIHPEYLIWCGVAACLALASYLVPRHL